MSKVVKVIVGVAAIAVGALVPGMQFLIGAGISMVGSALLQPKLGGAKNRAAAAMQVQIGEGPRQAIVGKAATAGGLVDAFNYGGKYGTDWEVLVLDLADHRCHGLEGFYVNDSYVAFAGDGPVAGYNGQLEVYWRPGTENQTVPPILTAHGPGWTANDNGAGVSYVVVAYKADDPEAKNPVWPGGRPRFLWIVRGAFCYDARKDSSVGGSGAHRIDQPATWEYSENPIVTRYKWVRGFYACDRVGDPTQLMIGRGLSAIEAPPANVFARANLCDEIVAGEPRYRVGGAIGATEAFLDVEEDFAAACAGTIVQPEGCVEIDPGEARAIVATFTDDDLVVGSRVRWNNRMLSIADDEWANTIIPSFIDPAQKWTEHSAPVRRDPADLIADGGPREQRAMLGFVTWSKQAQRVGEIIRRLGRLPGRGEVTLPPRFANIEEGDWVQWQSARRFKGATYTFRVEAWASNEKWHHTLTLRQISASVYSDTAPLDDGSVAYQPPAPPAIGAPAVDSWTLTSGYQEAGGVRTPALIVTGTLDDRNARFVRIEYVQGEEAPTPATQWADAGVTGPDVERREITAAAGGTYRVAISYVVDGARGERLILGPVTAGLSTYPDGTPLEDLQPAEAGATDGGVLGDEDNPGNITDAEGNPVTADDVVTSRGTAFNTSRIGPFTTAEFTGKMAAAEAQIAELLGTWTSGTAIVAAAQLAEVNAQQARDDASDAADAADAARIAAQTSATSADGSATSAAGSASAALASKNDAETASSAASSAKVAAESARDAAAGSATAASTSASTAATKSTEAGNSASAAAGSATDAATARGQAQTYAGQAATARDDAQGHAAMASAQATLSASSATAAQKAAQTTLPSTFEDGSLYFRGYNGTAAPNNASYGDDASYGPYIQNAATGTYCAVGPKGLLPTAAGKKWKLRALVAHVSGTAQRVRFYLEYFSAATGGTPVASTNVLSGIIISSATPVWVEVVIASGSYNFLSPLVVMNNDVGGATQRCYAIEIIDVDVAEQAAGSAAAAVISASIASTKATEAGASATAANSSKVAAESAQSGAASSASAASGSAATASSQAAAATTQAGLSATYRDQSQGYRNEAEGFKNTASTQAGIATSQATVATAGASAAQQSATLAASVGGGSLNKNPVFASWDVTVADYTRPTGWYFSSQNDPTVTFNRVAAGSNSSSPWALQMWQPNGTTINSIIAERIRGTAGGWYVVTLEAAAGSGSWQGSGLIISPMQSGGSSLPWEKLDCYTDKTSDGLSIQGGSANYGRKTWTKLVQMPALTEYIDLYLCAAYSFNVFGYTGATNPTKWFNVYNCSIRPATPAEIRDQTVLAPMEATVSDHTSVLATHDTMLATRVIRTQAGPTSAEVAFHSLASGGGAASQITMRADEVALGDMTKIALKVRGGDALFSGNINAGGGIFVGDRAIPVALQSFPMEVYDGQAVSYGASLGNIPDIVADFSGFAALPAGQSYVFRAEGHTPTGFTARVKTLSSATLATATNTGATSPGTGPTFQMHKADARDAYNGRYTFVVTGSMYRVKQELIEPPETVYQGYVALRFWVRPAGASSWTDCGVKYVGASPGPTGNYTYTSGVQVDFGGTIGLDPTNTEFGVSFEGGWSGTNTLTGLNSVSYQYQVSGSETTATPGNTPLLPIRVMPKNQ
ncbi:MAG: hypothetical protein WA978_11965 [Sphingopyxis granuli]|uniref:hypothetical protein n=1 Tax=Sphingopyxis granuli TaxID=267128 RepID=UPI003C78CDE8